MSRTTTMALRGPQNEHEVTMHETVVGRGNRTIDALQSLHENMLVRADEIALELRRLRGERL